MGGYLTVTLELLETLNAMPCEEMVDQEDGRGGERIDARKRSERAIKTLPFSLIVLRVSPPSPVHPQHYHLQQLQHYLRHHLLHPPQVSSAQAYKRLEQQ